MRGEHEREYPLPVRVFRGIFLRKSFPILAHLYAFLKHSGDVFASFFFFFFFSRFIFSKTFQIFIKTEREFICLRNTWDIVCAFVCVGVLRPSQPNGVMSSVVSLPNHTFIGQA